MDGVSEGELGGGVDSVSASLQSEPPPLRVNTHAAPTPPLSLDPPTMTMLPSADIATEGADVPTAPVPTSLSSCVQ